jgi:hypothetical protein
MMESLLEPWMYGFAALIRVRAEICVFVGIDMKKLTLPRTLSVFDIADLTSFHQRIECASILSEFFLSHAFDERPSCL